MAQIKISADTSPVKKSLIELSRELNNLSKSGSKVSLISESDKKFFKGELTRELGNIKKRLQENKGEITKLVGEAKKLVKGSQDELRVRKQINDAYRTQARLSRELSTLEAARNGLGGGGGSMLGKLGSKLGRIGPWGLAAGAVAAGGYWALSKAAQGRASYTASTSSRDRLSGLGGTSGYAPSMGSPQDLAAAGLSTQDMIDRRVRAISILGRGAGSTSNMLQQARFERAYGLEEGALSNVATSLRANFGGAGANEVQMKLQASIIASGLEDALGPYLDAATTLLARINENGMTSTSQMIAALGSLTATSGRSVEQLSKTFGDINSGITGASGESNAFIQAAFARAGIGGGTIGGTRLAIQAGGLFGMDESVMAGRYNPTLMKNLKSAGFFGNMRQRSGALLDQFKLSGGLSTSQSIAGITGLNQYVGLNSLANSVFGTQGAGGFEALQLLEKAEKIGMSSKDFQKELENIKAGNDPTTKRLDTVNQTLSGQLTVLNQINASLTMALGESQGNLLKASAATSNAATSGISGISRFFIGKGGTGSGISQHIKDTAKISSELPYKKFLSKELVEALENNTKALKEAKKPSSGPSVNLKIDGRPVKERTFK